MPRKIAYFLLLTILATGFTVTVFSQLPSNIFDRARRKDIFGIIPNWKFFAPIPATTDYEIFHRTQDKTGLWEEWKRTSPPAPRRLAHLVWFPGRRADKGIFDHVSELVQIISTNDISVVIQSSSYQILTANVHRVIADKEDLKAYQFAIIKHAGSDESIDPEVILLSPILPLSGELLNLNKALEVY